jgi:hypothetical protein
MAQTAMQLLRNDSRAGHWLAVELVGTTSNRTALGARATVYAGGRSQHQYVNNGFFCGAAQPAARMHFGLGAAVRADSVLVRWPDGQFEHFGARAADQAVVLTEGAGGRRSGK